jgi:hypothetical protein
MAGDWRQLAAKERAAWAERLGQTPWTSALMANAPSERSVSFGDKSQYPLNVSWSESKAGVLYE